MGKVEHIPFDPTLTWESLVYDDGARYEGLMQDGMCHVRGVFSYRDGDNYTGDYQENNMHGHGVYRWQNGSTFEGQWSDNTMHGCGVKTYPDGATEEGEWIEDNFVGEFNACDSRASHEAAAKAREAAGKAMMFSRKPDGELRDPNGNQGPIFKLQDRDLAPVPEKKKRAVLVDDEDETPLASLSLRLKSLSVSPGSPFQFARMFGRL